MKNYKKTILAIITFVTINSLLVNGQTNVSGGIYANTTWTLANSPYIVSDTVVVFPSVVLTIEPGVTVKFANNKRLEIRKATLIAKGTSTDSITFTSNAASPTPGIWDCIYLNSTPTDTTKLSFCKFLYANKGITTAFSLDTNWVSIKFCKFLNNQTGIIAGSGNRYLIKNCIINNNAIGINYVNAGYAPGIFIYNSSIEYNSNMGIALYVGANSVSNCLITHNGIGLYDENVIGRNYINNSIVNNDIGIKLGAYQNSGDSIFCNKICNNTTYNFYYNDTQGGSINVSKNYWCTTDSASIAAGIYDGHDNINLGLVNFMPFYTVQCSSPTGILTNISSPFSLNISPNPASGYLSVTLPKNISKAGIKIFNTIGELEFSSTSIEQTINIDISTLSGGIHIIEIEIGNTFNRQKFIKE